MHVRTLTSVSVVILAALSGGCRGPGITATAAHISVNPPIIEFGALAVGSTKSSELIITNTGAARLIITGIDLSGSAGFSCTGCAPMQLGASEQARVTVRFAPVDSQAAIGRILVQSEAANASEVLVSLAGNSTGLCTAENDAAFCARLGRNCGAVTAVDSCGAQRTVNSCGSCSGTSVCGASNVCGCVAESDAQLCAGASTVCGPLMAIDHCGAERRVPSCGTCGSDLVCLNGTCGCTPDSDSMMCARLGRHCGTLTADDNCGVPRTVASCGVCSGALSCGASNVCGCEAEPDAALCAAKATVCGQLKAVDRCGATRTIRDCGSCTGAYQTCGGGGTSGQCACAPESNSMMCARLVKRCGAVVGTDNCGVARSIPSCGTCTAAPAHAAPVCTASACDFTCATGYVRAGMTCTPCSGAALTNAPFAGGAGTPADPYLICTVAQLNQVRSVALIDAEFHLLADLDLSGVTFEPIGDPATRLFIGYFVGGGFSISNWHYNAPAVDYVGLFARVGSGTISGLRLIGYDVTGRDLVGALAGSNNAAVTDVIVSGSVHGRDYVGGVFGQQQSTATGVISSATVAGHSSVGGVAGYVQVSISDSSATGNVTGTGNSVGGFAGSTYGAGPFAISGSFATGVVSGVTDVGGLVGQALRGNTSLGNSYATGAVTGTSNVGGLVGSSQVPITNSYSLGAVTGASNVGGLVGSNNSLLGHNYSAGAVNGTTNVGGLVGTNGVSPLAIAADSFWDTTTSGQLSSAVGVGKTTAQLQSEAPFAKWNTYTRWRVGGGYPSFLATPAPCTVGATGFSGGIGTEANPYLIDKPAQLYAVGCNLRASYQLTADLDFTGQQMVPPIGSDSSGQHFSGTLDGNGKTISHWVSYGGAVALFGSVVGTIHDVSLTEVEVGGSVAVGALVSVNSGTLIKVRSSGIVRGVYVVGGLVGDGRSGAISKSWSSASIVAGLGTGGAASYAGGLVGYASGSVTNCYATGTVTSLDVSAGGLVGVGSTTVTNSYSVGPVSRGSGLTASTNSIATSCYWDVETSGQSTSQSTAIGKTTAQMRDQTTYVGWDFASVWQISAGAYPTLR